jgi:hypothetical protein
LDYTIVAVIIYGSAMGLFVLSFAIFSLSFVFSLFGSTHHHTTVNGRTRKYREEDFWDEPDGTMYVQLPNGEVRID